MIAVPVEDGLYGRSGSSLTILIQRPLDGSAQWYARNPALFDVQFQVRRERVVGKLAGAPTHNLGVSWTLFQHQA